MNEPKFHKWFHNFLICFALWAFAAFAVLFGAKFAYYAFMDGEGFLQVILSVLIMLLGPFLIKIRYDLARFDDVVLKEIMIAGIAGAGLCLALYFVQTLPGDGANVKLIPSAIVIFCLAVSVYRYYSDRLYLFDQ